MCLFKLVLRRGDYSQVLVGGSREKGAVRSRGRPWVRSQRSQRLLEKALGMPPEPHTEAGTDVRWRGRRSGRVPAPARSPASTPVHPSAPLRFLAVQERGSPGPPCPARRDSPRTRLRAAARPGMAAARPRPCRAAAAPLGPWRAPGPRPGPKTRPPPQNPAPGPPCPGPRPKTRPGGAPPGGQRPTTAPGGGGAPGPRRGGAELGFEKKPNQTKPFLEHLSYERLRELSLFSLKKTGRGFR